VLAGAALLLALAGPVQAHAGEPAEARPWSVAVEGGAALMPITLEETGGLAAVTVSRIFARLLELELCFRYQNANLSTHVDSAIRAASHLRFVDGKVALVPGLRLGYSAIQIHVPNMDPHWTGALLIQPGLDLRFLPLPWLELRVNVITGSVYWNELWIFVWEPTLGVGFRF